nr:outer spore coat protein CotE [Bacilli bacterium]
MLATDGVFREIITQAVCAKAKHYASLTHDLHPEHRPTTVGGCWVMNHRFEGKYVDHHVEVKGKFDTNVWYSFDGNCETAIAKDTIHYEYPIEMLLADPLIQETNVEVLVKESIAPNCIEAKISDDGEKISLQIDGELSIELIGPTKLLVMTCQIEDKKDPYEEESSFLDSGESLHL